jgi:hypothetical protein
MSKVNATAILLKAEATCTLPSILHEAEPIVGTWTFHKLISAIAAITSILTLLISLGNAARHLLHYTNPAEQRQIVRIIFTPLIFTIFNFFGLWFYDDSGYLLPFTALYEAFALVAIFILFLAFVCPDSEDYDTYFLHLERRKNFSQQKKHDRGSLRMFYIVWISVFQIMLTHLICCIADWVTESVMCPVSSKRENAKTAISVVQSVTTVICVVAILRIYRRLKPQLKQKGALSKLVCFKLIIAISIIQTPVFAGLLSGGVLKPSIHISYDDWAIGVPAFLSCCEMFIFSIVFVWPFGAKPYTTRTLDLEGNATSAKSAKAFFPALLHVLNLWDIISGAFFHNKIIKVFKKQPAVVSSAVDYQKHDQIPLTEQRYTKVSSESQG